MKKSRQYWDEGNVSELVGSRRHGVPVYVCVCVPSSLSVSKRGMDCSKTFFFFLPPGKLFIFNENAYGKLLLHN